jgi:hypothetical protein
MIDASAAARYDAGMARSRTTRIVLILFGVLLVLCCGVVVAGTITYRSIQAASGPARDAANAFLGQLKADDTSAAYANLCATTRSRFSAADFAATVHNRPRVQSYSIVGTSVANVNGDVSATVTANIRYADGSSENRSLPLVKDGDVWRICGQPY